MTQTSSQPHQSATSNSLLPSSPTSNLRPNHRLMLPTSLTHLTFGDGFGAPLTSVPLNLSYLLLSATSLRDSSFATPIDPNTNYLDFHPPSHPSPSSIFPHLVQLQSAPSLPQRVHIQAYNNEIFTGPFSQALQDLFP